MFSLELPIKIETEFNHEYGLPTYATEGASGVDLRANVKVEVKPYSTELIPTGIRLMSMPKGYELQVRPRSGVSLKTPLRVANSPGTIDSDYRGEIKIIMTNTSGDTVIIPLGERIAQLVPQTVPSIVFESSTEAEVTTRGAGGFGSTGQHV